MLLSVLFLSSVAVTQGSSSPEHSSNFFLHDLVHLAGYNNTCITSVLDYCSSAQRGCHFMPYLQEIQETKAELKKMKAEAQEGKEMVQQEVQGMMELISQVAYTLKVLPRHCKDLLDLGDSGSGLRQVYRYPGRPQDNVTVYCDQNVDGGGWTVFQRRVNNTVRENFYRNWTEYRAGFGDLEGEFWLGLDLLHELTKTEQELLVDMDDYEGEHRWAKYEIFRVGSQDTNYRLTVGRYSGDAGNAMTYHNGQQFSTHDADNNIDSRNCAAEYRGAWWYKSCHDSNLNGYQYVGDNSPRNKGIVWQHWRGQRYSLMRTTMMVRPAH